MHQDDLLEKSGELYGYAKEYLEVQKDYLKLEVAEKTSKMGATLLSFVIFSVFATIVMIFIGLAGGVFLAKWVDSLALAYLIMAGIYLLIAAIIYWKRTSLLIDPIIGYIIREIYQ